MSSGDRYSEYLPIDPLKLGLLTWERRGREISNGVFPLST